MSARLDLFGIIVKDMAASLAFYRRLGMGLPPEADQEPHVETSLPGGLRLAWDTEETIHSFNPDWQSSPIGARIALSFLVETPAEVDSTYDELVALGYDGVKAPWDAVWRQRYAIVHDPDGNIIDLFCPLA